MNRFTTDTTATTTNNDSIQNGAAQWNEFAISIIVHNYKNPKTRQF